MNQDLVKFLLRGYESKDLDYKGPTLWDEGNKHSCCEIVKDILAMENTQGGYIIVGVAEIQNGFEWQGLSHEQLSSYETSRINRFVQNYAEPPINTTLRKISNDGKEFVIIAIPQFKDTPHICQKDYPSILSEGQVYVRTDSNESAPIKKSSDMRGIVEQAIRNRGDALIASIRSILTGTPQTPKPTDRQLFDEQFDAAVATFLGLDPFKNKEFEFYREASFYLESFDATRFTLDSLKNAARAASVDFLFGPFLPVGSQVTYALQDAIQHLEATEGYYTEEEFWRLYCSGFLYQRTLSAEEPWGRQHGKPKIHDPT